MTFNNSELVAALNTGFVDHTGHSKDSYQPKLLVNDQSVPECVLDTILDELENCDSFFFSTAFATKSGVAVLLNSLLECERKNVRGKILVSEYLEFTQPTALRSLQQFGNIEVRIAVDGNMHGKAYVFNHNQHSSLVVGSSNLTANALKSNNELNIKFTSSHNGALYNSVRAQFERCFLDSPLADESYISEYEARYELNASRSSRTSSGTLDARAGYIIPNSMQRAALKNLKSLRERGEKKGLIISATGTGKTFLAAFDVNDVNPKKLLFVVHRRNIALKAMETFKKIFGSTKSYGLFSGDEWHIEKDFVFATVQTVSKAEHLESIDPQEFDYVIIDETHRAGAASYQKLIEHFRPEFLLGMTATPERTDGHDIFADFDHNIAYEIRLHQALEEKILSPFHYFGVTEIFVEGEQLGDNSDFNRLVSQDRIDHILNSAKRYGCDNGVVRGLIFCSRKDECIELSNQLNLRGLKTVSLTGDNSEPEREDAIQRLESDNRCEKLDYIVTVDIFNEGIDIPRVNQILMLRPTSSAIVFVQQLGRGLRKTIGKDHLTVIDFIGNYQNTYLIPIALYGDTSYNKDKIRRLVSSGSSTIPGSSTISFDEISRKRIFDSIDQSNLSVLTALKEDYKLLKYEIGRIPMMVDFVEYGRRDPFSFVDKKGSYHEFVSYADSSFKSNLSGNEKELLKYFSKEINNAKRVEDSIALRQIIKLGKVTNTSIIEEVRQIFGYTPSNDTINSIFHNLQLSFVTTKSENSKIPVSESLSFTVLQGDGNSYTPSTTFSEFLENDIFLEFLIDSTEYSILTWSMSYSKQQYIDGFLLYEKYSRKDVFRILNWAQNPVPQNVGGYLMSSDKANCAIFVNYDKHDHTDSTQYEDEFIDEGQLQWMSKNQRTLNSPEILQLQSMVPKTRLPLFIKKSNDEGIDFYYMGELTPIENSFEEAKIEVKDGPPLSAVTVRYNVNPPVEKSIYKYITAG